MYSAGDVRVENVPDAGLVDPTDALVRVTHAAICGSDLWPYKSMEQSESGRRMGHDSSASSRTQAAMSAPSRPAISSSRRSWTTSPSRGAPHPPAPGRVFDRVGRLDDVPDGYRAMNEREAIKVLIEL